MKIVPVTKTRIIIKIISGRTTKIWKTYALYICRFSCKWKSKIYCRLFWCEMVRIWWIQCRNSSICRRRFHSITIPSRYTILNNYFWGSYATSGIGNPTGRLTEVSQNSLIYAFDELTKLPGINATTYTNSIRIAARASTNNLNYQTTEMYSSQYIHTYSKLNLSPSISSGGSIDWGIGSSDEAWKLSSYCTTNF